MASGSSTRRITELDGVRGIAILLVLFYHYFVIGIHSTSGSPLAYFLKLSSLSWAGVDLFFVLSGFLIGGILIDNKHSPTFFAPFYIRRAGRILPLYLVIVLLTAIVPSLLSKGPAHDWLFTHSAPVWTCLAFVQNVWMGLENTHGGNWLGVTWSLAIEEQAYLILPLMVRWLPNRALPLAMLALAVSAPMFRAVYVMTGSYPLGSYVWPQCRWDAIAIGVLTAWYVRRSTMSVVCSKIQQHAYAVLAIALVGMLLLTIANQGIASLGMAIVGHTWLAVSSAALIIIAINPPPILKGTFNNRFLGWFGTVSYAVYLLHQPMSGLAHGIFRNSIPSIASTFDLIISLLALSGTLLLAAISWICFESKIVHKARMISHYGVATGSQR